MLTKSKSYYIPNIQGKIQALQDMSNDKRLEIFEKDFQSFKDSISKLENAINSLPPEQSRAKEVYSCSPQIANIKKKLEELSTQTARTNRLINESFVQPTKTYFVIPLRAMFLQPLVMSLCSASELKNVNREKWAAGHKEDQTHMTFGSAIGWRLLNVLLWPKFIIRFAKVLSKQIIDLIESLVKGAWNLLLRQLKTQKYGEWNRLLDQLKSQGGARWGLKEVGDSSWLFRIVKAPLILSCDLVNLIFSPLTIAGKEINDYFSKPDEEALLTFSKEENSIAETTEESPLLEPSTPRNEISSDEEKSLESGRSSPVSGAEDSQEESITLTVGVSATDPSKRSHVVFHGNLEKFGIFAAKPHSQVSSPEASQKHDDVSPPELKL